jgi:GMP synthase (glutamine-hydrolysing)
MKRVLVFQHVAHEILGTFHPLLKDAKMRIRYANFARHPELAPKMRDYCGLVVLGGPMGVYDADRYPHLRAELHCIREAVEQGKPVLGICLGAQLIASALGGEVKPTTQPEIGWYDVRLTEEGGRDPLLGELRPTERVFQWHQDAFVTPPGAVALADSERCPHQAFRYRDNVYGFQFHVEADAPMIARWLKVPSNVEQLQQHGFSPQTILADTTAHVESQVALGRRVFGRYLELFSTKRRQRTILSSKI